ncbi:MAG: ClpXP protease specificity-enhancing factor SspB [Nitrosomonas sp.]|nr:ClpXP protease specificity-enhancing factor [Nitrosomonas sp.]
MKDIAIKPYLIRAVYEWCIASEVAPHLTAVSIHCHNLPENLVLHEDVTLNIDPVATDGLSINDEFVQFNARFNGISRKILIPIEAVKAIFSKELEHGLSFTPETKNEKVKIPVKTIDSKINTQVNRDKSFLKIVK